MFSRKQKDEAKRGKYRAFPPEDKHTMTVSEKQSSQTSSSLKGWRLMLFGILGIVMPLIAGSMVYWSWGVGDIFDSGLALGTVVLAMFVLVSVGSGLLYGTFRVWWATLFAPVAWVTGELLGAVVRPLAEGGWPVLLAQEHFWDTQITILEFALPFLVVATFLGKGSITVIDGWLQKRRNQDKITAQ